MAVAAITDSHLRTRLAEGLSQRRVPSLDGLRAVAVLLVLFNHLEVPYAPDGRGVMTFFVLSGFLITWILLNESNRYGQISIRDFYIRRALRILPAFYVFWFLHFLIFLITRGTPNTTVLSDYLSSFFYVSNYRRALAHGPHQYLSHLWALSVEGTVLFVLAVAFCRFSEGSSQAEPCVDWNHRGSGSLPDGVVL